MWKKSFLFKLLSCKLKVVIVNVLVRQTIVRKSCKTTHQCGVYCVYWSIIVCKINKLIYYHYMLDFFELMPLLFTFFLSGSFSPSSSQPFFFIPFLMSAAAPISHQH